MSQHHIWQQIPVYLSLPLLHFLLFVTSPFLPHKYRYTLSPKASFFCPLKDSDPLKALRCISVCCYGCVLRPLCLIWMGAFVKVEERGWEIVKEKKWHGNIETHIEDKSSALRSRDKNRTVIKICSLKEHGMRKILLGSFVVDKMLKNQGSLLASLVPRRIFNINGIFHSTKGSSEYSNIIHTKKQKSIFGSSGSPKKGSSVASLWKTWHFRNLSF